MRMKSHIAASLLLCVFCRIGAAQVCAPYIEEHPAWNTASFRAHTAAAQACRVGEETYRQVIHGWLQQRAADAPSLASLSLGRAENFPWLSHHLADTALRSHEWHKRLRRATPGEHNQYVADILSEPTFLQRLDQAFNGSAYRVASVSVEKVLAGKASEYASGNTTSNEKVPFDAQVWLRLVPRK